jgi:hypothetical protein
MWRTACISDSISLSYKEKYEFASDDNRREAYIFDQFTDVCTVISVEECKSWEMNETDYCYEVSNICHAE